MAPKLMSRAVRAHAKSLLFLAAAVIPAWVAGMDVARPDDTPAPIAPPAAEGNIAYKPQLKLDGDDANVELVIESASLLFELREEPLDAVGALFERARTDQPRIQRALNALGFFSARVDITIDGSAPNDIAAEDRLATNPPAGALAVIITVTRGPLFTLGSLSVVPSPGASAAPLAALKPKVIGLQAGAPARSSDVIAADALIVASLREDGYPLAKVVGRDAVADHATAKLDVTFKVDAGPKASMGDVTVKGAERMDPKFVAGLGSSRVDLQACKLEYSIVSPK